jgi:two-component system sensor histidine kinase HydH
VVFAALTAAALLVSAGLAWSGVHDAATTVARGDAQRALREVERAIGHEGPPTQAELDAALAATASEGVVFIAMLDHAGAHQAGVPVQGAREPLPVPSDVDREGDTWRAVGVRGPPGPHGPPAPPPLDGSMHGLPPPDGPMHGPGFGHGPPMGPPGGPHGPPRVVIELVPRTALALEARATTSLGVGLLAALLIVATSLAWRRAALERAEAVAGAARSKHLSALGEMSAVLAHEIRNPLASLKGHAQLLEESLPEGTRDQAKAARIVREAQRIERLTTDLLAFVRSGTLSKRSVDPCAVAREAIDAVGAEAFELVAGGAPAHASLDPDRVRGALENLLRNAREAAPDVRVEVAVTTDDGALVVRVRDRGPGIPAGDEEKIFEPFHTTRVHGTGLGLAVARRVAEAHGGGLRAENAEGGGAVFTMRLALGTAETTSEGRA